MLFLPGMHASVFLVPLALVAASRGATSAPERGTAELRSFGTVQIELRDGTTLPALHVRMKVVNLSDDPAWSIDAREAMFGMEHAILANSDASTLPVVVLGRGQAAVIDFYFSVLPGISADFLCPIQTPLGPRLARARLRSVAAGEHPALGVALHWWANPAYPWPTYRRQDGVITSHPPAGAVVR